jgi:hypothetical protein
MISAGEIYLANTDAGIRPAVVVSREELNRGNWVVAVLVSARSYQPRRRPTDRIPCDLPPVQTGEPFPKSVPAITTRLARPSRGASAAPLYAAIHQDGPTNRTGGRRTARRVAGQRIGLSVKPRSTQQGARTEEPYACMQSRSSTLSASRPSGRPTAQPGRL